MFLHEIDDELKGLTFQFFYKFSRFEFSLKKNGFGKVIGKRNVANPDWKRFRERYEGDYLLSIEAKELLKEPPKVQVIEHGELKFIPEIYEENETDLRIVIGSVNRIRNNLFHGGKQGCGTEGELNRNKYLLSAGIVILDELSKLDNNIESDYPGFY